MVSADQRSVRELFLQEEKPAYSRLNRESGF